jgi:anti-sigma regulatory factor (Ser/Thr protein kinase)
MGQPALKVPLADEKMFVQMPDGMNAVNAKEAFHGISDIEVKSSLPRWICLRIAPELALKEKVVGFFRVQWANLSDDLCERLCLALDELLGNAMEHGGRVEPRCGCELTYLRTPRMILLQIRDAGPGFSLNAIDHAAVNNPPEDPLRHAELRLQKGMRPGGFGIMLVKQIADDLIYNEAGNEVVLVKYL